jgi:hypothetical protein
MLKDLYEEATRGGGFLDFKIRSLLWTILIVDVLTLLAVLK